jgi:adenylylsulfate kinase
VKILIFGLPGSGKTYLAQELTNLLGDKAEWFNADTIRTEYDDWDFSAAGRKRQNQRMRTLADQAVEKGKVAICDFICPLEIGREAFDADFEIFMDTIEKGRFADTNRLFQRPDYGMYDCIIPNYAVKKMRGDVDAKIIAAQIEEMIKST